jgi:hypothetical protein
VKRERRGRGRRYRHGLPGTSPPQKQFSFPRLLVLSSSSSELRAAHVTLQKYFSHPSLVISFFPQSPLIKLKLGLQKGRRDSTNSNQIRNKEAKVPKIHPAQQEQICEASRVGRTRGAQRERENGAGPYGR